MDNRQSILDNVWQALQKMPRMRLNLLFTQMGLSKSMFAKLQDTDARKLFLGIVTRFDDAELRQVLPLVQA